MHLSEWDNAFPAKDIPEDGKVTLTLPANGRYSVYLQKGDGGESLHVTFSEI